MNRLAQGFSTTELGKIGGDSKTLGPFGNIPLTETAGLQAVANTISSFIGIMTIAAGLWFLIQFLTGGFFWITSGGDKTRLETARHRINDAFVGLLIVVAGWSILALASQFFGVDFLLKNTETLLPKLLIKSVTP